jgi:hypothetical protein
MQGLPNDIEGSNTRWSRPEDRVLLPGLMSKLLDPGTRLEEGECLSRSGNTIDIQELRRGRRIVEGGDPSVQDSGSGSADRSGKQKQMTEGNERVRGRCSRITSSK